eukprot:1052427-Rhodomonas_salina.1
MADEASGSEVVSFEYDGPSRLLSEVWPVWHPECKTSRSPSYLWLYTIKEETSVKDVCETFGLNLPQFVAYNDDSVQSRGSILQPEDAVIFPHPPKRGHPSNLARENIEGANQWFFYNSYGPVALDSCFVCGATSSTADFVAHVLFYDVIVCRKCDLTLRHNFWKPACCLCGKKIDAKPFNVCVNSMGDGTCIIEFCDSCLERFPMTDS